MMNVVREMTGEWIEYVPCSEIQSPDRHFYDELVFFGDEQDFHVGGIAENLITLGMIERYGFEEQRVAIMFNDDPVCRVENDLDRDSKWVVMFNGPTSPPHAFEYSDGEPIEVDRLLYLITTSIVKATPKWGQRANGAIFNYM